MTIQATIDTIIEDIHYLSIHSDIQDIVDSLINKVESIVNLESDQLLFAIRNVQYDISNEPSLKLAHMFCIKNKISSQMTGTLIENYIIDFYQMKKNNSSLSIGDANLNGINYEIKVSCGGKNRNKFNYVQLRMNHNCSYLFTAYYLNQDNLTTFGELFIFKLDKKSIINMIVDYGSYAHGTIKNLGKIDIDSVVSIDNMREYALRIKFNSAAWIQLLKFRIHFLDI
jgi:hypothetical protein